MDFTLLPISLVLNFILLGAFGGVFFLLSRRGKRIAELEGRSAAQARGLQRELEEAQASLEGSRDYGKELEVKLAELREQGQTDAATDAAAWQQERINLEAACAVEAAKLEPVSARLKAAELEVAKTERECARLRSEAMEARKRMEAAEGKASEQITRFEQLEVAHQEKTAGLKAQQAMVVQLEKELAEWREDLQARQQQVERLESEAAVLQGRFDATSRELSAAQSGSRSLQDELAETRQALQEVRDQLAAQQRLAEEAASSGGEAAERCQALEQQVLDLEGRLNRKEAAFVDLETAHKDASTEEPYAAHRHMEWTLNHFDPKSITFKFTNAGARVYLVGVETDVPELRYEFETGHDLPREDFEARIKLAIKKAEEKRLAQLPDEFEVTVLYALHVFPIRFKIRPREGQKIERIY